MIFLKGQTKHITLLEASCSSLIDIRGRKVFFKAMYQQTVVDAGHLIQSAVLSDKNTMDEQPDRLLRPSHYRLA